MENEAAFLKFLKRNGRSADVAQRVLRLVNEFEQFLLEQGKTLDQASPQEVNAFVNQIEAKPGTSAKTHLWAIIYPNRRKAPCFSNGDIRRWGEAPAGQALALPGFPL
jgi:hypothetical protein